MKTFKEMLDESLYGIAGRLALKGLAKGAKRLTVAGRADAAERKLKKAQNKHANKQRLHTAKSSLKQLKKS